MIETAFASTADSIRFAPRRDRRIPLALGLATALVVVGLAWWFYGGDRLTVQQGNTVGMIAKSGELVSFGVDIDTDGVVELQSVEATVTPGATVVWSVYHPPRGGTGLGTWRGALAPDWDVQPVAGFEVRNDGQPTQLIATVTANDPGRYRISRITATYTSGGRTRTSEGGMQGCVVVTPSGFSADSVVQSDEPSLQDKFASC